MGRRTTRTGPGRRRNQRGVELIEFALTAAFLLPVLLGTFVAGVNLIRANQSTHVTRDLGSLYVHGVDFSLSANRDLAVRLASGLNLQNSPSSGNGLIILSQVTFIGDATCTANSLAGSSCTNRNQYVFTQQLTIGNTSLRSSSVGRPTAAVNGSGMVQNYITDMGARVAPSFAYLWNPQLTDGQYIYAVEGFFTGIYLGTPPPGGGIYSRHFF